MLLMLLLLLLLMLLPMLLQRLLLMLLLLLLLRLLSMCVFSPPSATGCGLRSLNDGGGERAHD